MICIDAERLSHECPVAAAPIRPRGGWRLAGATHWAHGLGKEPRRANQHPASRPPAARDEWHERLARFQSFIAGLVSPPDGEPLVSAEVAKQARSLWWCMCGACPGWLPIPDVGPGSDGELLLIWKREGHYLSIQVTPDAMAEAFYRNHSTRQIWSAALSPSADIPREVVEKLAIFVSRPDR